MTYVSQPHGSLHDHAASRRISDSILEKLTQLDPDHPNVLMIYTDAFMSMDPAYLEDAVRLLQHVDEGFLRGRGFSSGEEFLEKINRISMIAMREEGVVSRAPRNTVYQVGSARHPLPEGFRGWLENLNFDGTATQL